MVKRTLDVLVAAAVLALASPIIGMAALAIRLSMGSPVLFRQTRPGLEGRPFEILKLRTMKNTVDAAGVELADAERITVLGELLRRTSIDELPQMWNILRGDMSLVGPRPLLMEYLPRYTQEQARRHEVRPGVTGWTQVNGRNTLSWEEKFRLDVWYVDNRSLSLDLRILMMTMVRVVRREDISQQGHATTEKFRG